VRLLGCRFRKELPLEMRAAVSGGRCSLDSREILAETNCKRVGVVQDHPTETRQQQGGTADEVSTSPDKCY